MGKKALFNIWVIAFFAGCKSSPKLPVVTIGSADVGASAVYNDAYRNNVDLAVAQINQAGLFELVVEHAAASGADFPTVSHGVEGLLDHVQAMIMSVTDPVNAPALATTISGHDIVTVVMNDPFYIRPTNVPAAPENGSDNFFFPLGDVIYQATVNPLDAAVMLVGDNVVKLALVCSADDAADLAIYQAFAPGWATIPGGHVAQVITYPAGTSDFTATLQSAVDFGADGIYFLGAAADAQGILTTMSQSFAAFTGSLYIGGDLYTRAFGEQVPRSVVTRVRGIGFSGSGPEWDAYNAAFLASFQVGPDNNALFTATYDGVMTLGLAIAKAIIEKAPITAATLRANMVAVANPPGTAVGPGDFAAAVKLLKSGTDIDYHGAQGLSGADDLFDFGATRVVGTKIDELSFDTNNNIVIVKDLTGN